MIDLTMFCLTEYEHWNYGLGKHLEHFNYCLMDHINRNMEGSGAECDLMNCGGLDQNVSEDKNFSMLPRDHSCDI